MTHTHNNFSYRLNSFTIFLPANRILRVYGCYTATCFVYRKARLLKPGGSILLHPHYTQKRVTHFQHIRSHTCARVCVQCAWIEQVARHPLLTCPHCRRFICSHFFVSDPSIHFDVHYPRHCMWAWMGLWVCESDRNRETLKYWKQPEIRRNVFWCPTLPCAMIFMGTATMPPQRWRGVGSRPRLLLLFWTLLLLPPAYFLYK